MVLWHSNQVSHGADACKIALCQISVIMAICSYILCVCCNISEKKGLLLLLIFGTVINHNRDLIHVKDTLALYKNVACMSIIS